MQDKTALLTELEEVSGLMFTKKEMAEILEIPYEQFCEMLDDDEDPVYREAVKRGRLKAEAAIRKSIFDLASNGSSPAQAFAYKLIENAKLDDI